MPLMNDFEYAVPGFAYRNPHLTTIYLNKLRAIKPPAYERTRVELPDGDFLDIDFIENNRKKAILLCHGLEGNSIRNYNNSAANLFFTNNFSVFAWNNRSCSGEMNRLLKLYHHTAIDDLDQSVKFVLDKGYEEVYLLGYSMGGVQILNYFGKLPIDQRIKAGVAVSAPVNLKSSAEILKQGFNRIYLKNFLIAIKKKLNQKALQFPGLLDWKRLELAKDFDDIDEYFTAPAHGFVNAVDYYEKASPINILQHIKIPILILNALDDPFLDKDSYPTEFASNSKTVFLETPGHGGHCAFPLKNDKLTYSAQRAYEFFNSEMTFKGL